MRGASLDSMTAAAFFDLDRTLIRRSSALALAGPFRESGVIGARPAREGGRLAALFAAAWSWGRDGRKGAEDGLMVLRGPASDDLRDLVGAAHRSRS